MGIGSNRSIKPDLFSARQPDSLSDPVSEPKSLPARPDERSTISPPTYALPSNLQSALKHLADDQLDRLLAAVLAERQARGGKNVPVSKAISRNSRTKDIAPPLAQGKLNAVRAAFKAGVTPSRIARQFGISQADVRKALAKDGSKA